MRYTHYYRRVINVDAQDDAVEQVMFASVATGLYTKGLNELEALRRVNEFNRIAAITPATSWIIFQYWL